MKNSIGMKGIDFVEFTGATPEMFEKLFFAFGFSKKQKLAHRPVYYFNQQDIHFFFNQEKGRGFSRSFRKPMAQAYVRWVGVLKIQNKLLK